MACGNVTEAALKAGYSESYSKDRIHKTIKYNVGICRYIEELRKEIRSPRIAEMTEVQEFWADIMRDKKAKVSDRLKASEYIAKTNGAFLEKLEVKGMVPVMIVGEDELED